MNTFRLKQLVQDTVGHFGYELHRKRPLEPHVVHAAAGIDQRAGFEPFVEQVALGGVTFEFWVTDAIAKQWYNPEGHARVPEHRETARLVRAGDRVMDIGAHHGFSAMLFSKLVGERGFVLCVEPSPANAIIAAAQIGLNRATNCQVLQAAACDRSGSVRITRDSNAFVTQSSDNIEVPAFTADDLDRNFGPFNVVKIDVEGFEHQVLLGASQLLQRRPAILLELHSPVLPPSTVGAILELLRSYQGTFMPRYETSWDQLRPFPEETPPREVISNLFISSRG
jgi:FkbM family methyltransferase